MRTTTGYLAALLLLLTGCPTSSFTVRPREEPLIVEPKGDYVHPGTGMTFPASVAGLARSTIEEYDHDAFEVGVHYRCFRGLKSHATGSPFVVISVYAYPAFEDDGNHLAGVEGRIGNHHEDVRRLHKRPATYELGGREVRGLEMVHEYRDPSPFGDEERTSRTILVRLPGHPTPDWFVKYRITCASDRVGEVEPEVERFLSTLVLP